MRFGVEPIDDPQLDQVRNDWSKAWHYVELVEKDGQPNRWYQIASDPSSNRIAYLRKLAVERYGPVRCRGLRFKIINGEDKDGNTVRVLCARLEPDMIEPGEWERHKQRLRKTNAAVKERGRRADPHRGEGGTVEEVEAAGTHQHGDAPPPPDLEGFGIGGVTLPDATDDGVAPRAVGDE